MRMKPLKSRGRLVIKPSVVLATLVGVLAVSAVTFPLLAGADDVPADKQRAIDATPSPQPPDLDDSFGGGHYPINARGADTGKTADINAVKNRVVALQSEYLQAQYLSADKTTAYSEASYYRADVLDAAARGTDAFVGEAGGDPTSGAIFAQPSGVSDFRIKMVDVWDNSVVINESVNLSGALLDQAADGLNPSLIQTTFTVLDWQGVQVSGNNATALVVGVYANCFQGGVYPSSECTTESPIQWQISLHKIKSKWRWTKRVGNDLDPTDFDGIQGTPPPGETPPPTP
jgi:hypothetical protein